ncbi:hypothetical protein BDD12DRAFT_835666 [Trichophaea hybrida]|nr:hypothetical protein BDD12DRAFT_835666 [Trichophaea hybrida]
MSLSVRRQARLRLYGDDSHWLTNRYELAGPRVGSRSPWRGINRDKTLYANTNGTSQGRGDKPPNIILEQPHSMTACKGLHKVNRHLFHGKGSAPGCWEHL